MPRLCRFNDAIVRQTRKGSLIVRDNSPENSDRRDGRQPFVEDGLLVWPRFFAGLSISWERLWPLLLPFLVVIAGFLIVSWFELWRMVPDLVRIGLVAVFGFMAIASLAPLRRFRIPSMQTIDQRIEHKSNLSHRPVTAQSDILATSNRDGFAEVLWQEHRARMSEKLKGLKSGTPNLVIAETDPYGLRAVVILLLFIGFGYASGDRVGRITAAFSAQTSVGSALARLDVWISPPSYTNRPPLFLKRMTDDGNGLNFAKVPEGSVLVVRVASNKAMMLDYSTAEGQNPLKPVSAEGIDDAKGDTGIVEYRHVLEISGTANLTAEGGNIGSWQIDIIADDDPKIRFSDDPKRGRGRMLELAYLVEDDYGVVSAVANILPLNAGERNARPLVKPPTIILSLPRQRLRQGAAKLSRDLSQHPFAGGKVNITLVAKDGAGQVGKSETKQIVLPARYFTKPLAAALVEQRRVLAKDARSQRQVANMLDIIANTAPEEFIDDIGIFTGLQVTWRSIARARNDDELRDGLDLLWNLALAIEDGDLSEAASRLREAQEALKEALENGASEEEIARLMRDLRQAMNEYLKELTQQIARDNKNQNFQQDENSQTLRKQDLDRMMDRIEELAKSGSKDAAQQLLSEMQQLMDQLQAGRHQQQRQREGDQFNQQMNKLSEMMQNQQNLMDETFRMQQQRQQNQGRQDNQRQGQQNKEQRQGQQNRQGQMTQKEIAEAMRQLQRQQGALQKQLQDMMKGLEQQGMDPGRELGKAGKSMGKASGALGEGNSGEALRQQGQALNSMRKGAQAMMQQMQQNMAGERGGTDQNGQQQNNQAGKDPLGRQQRTRGPNFGSNLKVPDEIDAQTAREILESIRRKLANPSIPKLEFNYLDRLLKRQ